MTVAELIQELQKHPPELRVVTEGYEDGYDDVAGIIEMKIMPSANPNWWVGIYDHAVDSGERAIFINGNSKGKDIN